MKTAALIWVPCADSVLHIGGKDWAMVGPLDKQHSLLYRFSIEDHITQDHQLRKIDWLLDFSPIRQELVALHSHTGRPSIGPELMTRMLLVGYLY